MYSNQTIKSKGITPLLTLTLTVKYLPLSLRTTKNVPVIIHKNVQREFHKNAGNVLEKCEKYLFPWKVCKWWNGRVVVEEVSNGQ